MSRRILVIDDEQGIRAALGQLLEYEGYEVHTLANAVDGIAEYQKWRPHLVFLDVKMAGMDGMEALRKLRELDPSATVVMISGHATIRTAVEATQAGAYEILEKPLDTDRILVMLRNALSHLDLQEENARLKQSIDAPFEIVGKTPVMRALMEKVEKVATTPARVLITGENGTGKELVARALHRMSPRATKPFVEVNCAAIPGELIESELFGHMKDHAPPSSWSSGPLLVLVALTCGGWLPTRPVPASRSRHTEPGAGQPDEVRGSPTPRSPGGWSAPRHRDLHVLRKQRRGRRSPAPAPFDSSPPASPPAASTPTSR